MRNHLASRIAAFRNWTLATIAGIGLGCSASVSSADIAQMLPQAKIGAAAAPRQVLPALSNPRPFRQAVLVNCDKNTAALGPNTCVMGLSTVPAGRVLQLDKITCLGGAGGGAGYIFNGQIKVDDVHLVGLVLPPYDGVGGSVASGPYYFKAGERPRLAMSGNSPTEQALCSTSGTIWSTN